MNDNPYLSIDRQMVGDIYTSPEAMDNLTILQRRLRASAAPRANARPQNL